MVSDTKYIIVNTNKTRDCFYTYGYADGTGRVSQSVPYFLEGDYIKEAQGQATNDLTRAHLYDDKVRAERQVKQLTERYKPGGKHWQHGGSRYPDNCGNAFNYTKYAPQYEVREVKVTVEVVE